MNLKDIIKNIQKEDSDGFDNEAIGNLDKDPIKGKVEKSIGELYDLHKRSILAPNLRIREDKKSDEILSNLEKELSKRFGFTINLYGTSHGAHCIITPPPENNVVMPDSAKIHKNLKGVMDGLKVKKKNLSSKIKKDTDYEEIYQTLHKSLVSLEESYIGKNVFVDVKNAKITGLNKDVVVFIGIPFKGYFSSGLSEEEVIAILFHEIGHAYYTLSSMHQLANAVITTSDSLNDDSLSEEKLLSLSENVYNTKIKSSSELFLKLFSGEVAFDNSSYHYKNNEVSADQFATRFGYGGDIVSALSKFYNVDSESSSLDMTKKYFKALGFLFLSLLGLIIMTYLVVLSLSFLVFVSPFIISFLFVKFMVESIQRIFEMNNVGIDKNAKIMTIEKMELKDTYDPNSSYDDLKQRFKRIKMDMIRQLRNSNLAKKTEKDFLRQIRNIEGYMNNVEQEKGTLVLFGHFFMFRRNDVGSADFFMRLEEMVENDFHARYLELKNLI